MLRDIFDMRKVKRLILYILIVIFAFMIGRAKQAHNDRLYYEDQLIQKEAELTEHYETEIFNLKRSYEYGGDITTMEMEAEYIAKVIYGTARNHSTDGQKAVIWCILNRVEHQSYPDTIKEVCEQELQWMGYAPNNPVLNDIYELALNELKVWYNNGHRPMSNDYIFLSWSSDEIILRDTFEEGRYTHYWRVK